MLLVLTHADKLLPELHSQLEELRRARLTSDKYRISAALAAVDASTAPASLGAAAAPQLAWLRSRVEAHARRFADASLASASAQPLRVQSEIPCVMGIEFGDSSLLHLHAQVQSRAWGPTGVKGTRGEDQAPAISPLTMESSVDSSLEWPL